MQRCNRRLLNPRIKIHLQVFFFVFFFQKIDRPKRGALNSAEVQRVRGREKNVLKLLVNDNARRETQLLTCLTLCLYSEATLYPGLYNRQRGCEHRERWTHCGAPSFFLHATRTTLDQLQLHSGVILLRNTWFFPDLQAACAAQAHLSCRKNR